MKKTLIAFMIAGVFLASCLTLMVPANAKGETIEHLDPSGDVDNSGFGSDVCNNVDITSLNMAMGTEAVVFEMTVLGMVVYEDPASSYSYNIYIDHDGDDQEDSILMVGYSMGFELTSFSSSDGYWSELDIEGNGTDTLTVTIPLGYIETTPTISDIYGEASVWDLSWNYSEDYVNEEFGAAPVEDDEPDDDEWDDEWDYELENEYSSEGDPTEEEPTDTSISVSIDDYGMRYDETDDTIEIELTAEGSTSGDVVKCAMTTVTYMKDGSNEVEDWDLGPVEEPRGTFMGVTYEMYFKGTGPGGSDDWASWGFLMYMKTLKETYDEYMGDDEEDLDNVTRVVMVMRAFGDENMTLWNQDTQDITAEFKAYLGGEPPEKDDDDDGILPGFEIFGAVVALVAATGAGRALRRRR